MYAVGSARRADTTQEQAFYGYREMVGRRAFKVASALALLVAGTAIGLVVEGASGGLGGARNALAVGLGTVGLALGVILYAWGAHDLNAFARKHPRVDDLNTAGMRSYDAHMLGIGVLAGIALVMAGAGVGGVVAAPLNRTLGTGLFLLFIALGVWAIAYTICLAGRSSPLRGRWADGEQIDVAGKARRSGQVGVVCFVAMAASTVVALALLSTPGEGATYFWLAWAAGGAVCGAIALITGSLRRPHGER